MRAAQERPRFARVIGSVLLCCALLSVSGGADGQRRSARERPELSESVRREATERAERYYRDRQEQAERRRETAAKNDAIEEDSFLVQSTKKVAHRRIQLFTRKIFIAHLKGLTAEAQTRVGFNSQANIATVDIDIVRASYVADVDRRIELNNKSFVDQLSIEQQRLILAFAKKTDSTNATLKTLQSDTVDAWWESLVRENEQLNSDFKIFNETHWKNSLTPFEQLTSRELTKGAHEDKYRAQALDEFLSRKDSINFYSFGVANWRFLSSQIHDFEPIWRFLRHLNEPLPGAQPHLVYFLDPIESIGATEKMTKAWIGRGRSPPVTLDNADGPAFLRKYRGQTVLLVGHIEGRQFVMERSNNAEPLRLDIARLISQAQQQNVLLIPIGCSSANAGALFGFIRPISTSEVASLFEAIPARNMVIGELLSAFNQVGSVAVDVTKFGNYVEFAVRRRTSKNGDSLDEVVFVFRIPMPVIRADSSFQEFYDDWESVHRPWSDRGVIRDWRSAYRAWPIRTLIFTGVILLFCSAGIQRLARHLSLNIPLRKQTKMLLTIVLWSFPLIPIAAAIVHLLVIFWPVLVWLIGGALIIALLEPIFGERK